VVISSSVLYMQTRKIKELAQDAVSINVEIHVMNEEQESVRNEPVIKWILDRMRNFMTLGNNFTVR
jgi:hypothetical protein